jgi:hypothetical protein
VLKPPPFKGNSISFITTTLTSTTPASVTTNSIANNSISKTNVNINPYKLNKLNPGKPGFIKNKKIIIRYKFKYFEKGNKKG